MKRALAQWVLLSALLSACAVNELVFEDGGASRDGTVPPDGAAMSDGAVRADSASTCTMPQTSCSGAGCVNLASDPRHCGRCDRDCTTLPGVSRTAVSCADGVCVPVCLANRAHCSAAPDDGCEVDLTTPANCGRCGNACAAPAHATAVCNGTTCGFTCDTGFADCDHNPANGCEASLSDATHCGSCSTACVGMSALCSAGGCTNGCVSGTTLCGTSCVDTNSDAFNCGGCMRSCPTPTHGTAVCLRGGCSFHCDSGFHVCSSAGSALCLSNTSVASCGMSCTACSTPMNGRATCDGANCGISCDANFHPNATGGCDPNNIPSCCGSTCMSCLAPSNGSAVCGAGLCGINCNSGYHQSDSSCVPDAADAGIDGCVGTRTDPLNCGICSHRCGTNAACMNGTCVCPTGFVGSGDTGCMPTFDATATSG